MGRERGLVPTPLPAGTAHLGIQRGSQALLPQKILQPFLQRGLGTKAALETHWGALGCTGRKGESKGVLGEGACGEQWGAGAAVLLPRGTGDPAKRQSWGRDCVLGHAGGSGGTGMGMQREPWARGSLGRIRGAGEVSGVSAGLHWAVLGQTGMAWGVVAVRGEGVTAAELLVPTRGVFRMSTPACRETRRPRWSLGCPRCQQEMGGPKCPPVPRGDALQSQHPTHLPEIILGSFQECLGKDNKGWVRIGPCGAGGGHGCREQGGGKGMGVQGLQGDLFAAGGRPKDTDLG